jgi:predicted SnoaL-like aldol condensation-catalyzing enzyme
MVHWLSPPVLMLVCSATSAATPEEERDKRIAIDFYNAALNDKNWDEAARHLGSRYVQHSIYMADGRAGLEALVRRIKAEFPQNRGEIKQAFVDGDMVILHLHVTRYPGHPGWSVIELMRVENEKVVEHWDIFQPVPNETANANGMF